MTVPTAPITIGITITFMSHIFFNSLARSWYLSLFSLSFNFTQWSAGTTSPQFGKISFFCLVAWPRFGDPFVFQNLREDCASHFQGRILSFAYTICSYGQTSISCTIPCGSPCPPSRVSSYTLSVLFCCIISIVVIVVVSSLLLFYSFFNVLDVKE